VASYSSEAASHAFAQVVEFERTPAAPVVKQPQGLNGTALSLRSASLGQISDSLSEEVHPKRATTEAKAVAARASNPPFCD
jgi:hypothetical protein